MDGRLTPPPPTPLPLGRLAIPATGIVLVMLTVLALFVAVLARFGASVDELRARAASAREQSAAANQLLLALTDAETGQRGFLLTHKAGYLEPYWTASAEVGQALDRLDGLAVGDVWLGSEADTLRGLASTKLAELESTITADRQHGTAAALGIVFTDAGQATMDAVRRHARLVISRAEAERDRLTHDLQWRERYGILAMMAAALIGVLLLGAASLWQLSSRARLAGARDALRRQWDQLRAAISQARDGVAVFDASDRLLLWNETFFPVTGLPQALARPGMGFADFVAASAAWSEPLGAARPARDARPQVTETRIAESGQPERVLEVWRSAMPDGGQMLACADITRRMEAEAVARQAYKMDALGQLTGGVAHDFNNLLQVISANLELLRGHLADEWQRSRIAGALAGVERGARLTRYLLAFARRQPLAPRAVDMSLLLGGMQDMLGRTLGEAVTIGMVIGDGLWAVRADPQQLENAVLNLAINARDAMPEGGRLIIEAKNVSLDAGYAAENAEVTPGQYVMIALTDTGIGMSAEQIARAVEPFYTTKSEGQGTGLGLSMVYGFAKQSGGHFKLYSEPGHGTTVRLYVPRTGAEPSAAAAQSGNLPQGAGELVLIVEDDASVRAVAASTLREFGYRCLEAERAEVALAMLQEGARPDLLFTDVVMPGSVPTRIMVAEAQRVVGERLGVLYTSGYTENSITHNGQLDAGVRLIAKPWRAEELARAVRSALDAARSLPPAASRLRILLVEDEKLVRMTTAEMLGRQGHDVVEAATGAEALRLLDKADMLITDIGLPDLDGRRLARQAREGNPGLAIIIASGSIAEPEAIEGAYEWLEKPYDEAALGAAVARAARVKPAPPKPGIPVE